MWSKGCVGLLSAVEEGGRGGEKAGVGRNSGASLRGVTTPPDSSSSLPEEAEERGMGGMTGAGEPGALCCGSWSSSEGWRPVARFPSRNRFLRGVYDGTN